MPHDQEPPDRLSDLDITLSERFKALFEHMQEGVALHEVICDEAGKPVDYRIIEVNPQYERHTGVTRERAVGQLASAAYGTSEPPYLAEFCAVGMGGPPLLIETYFAPLDRHFHISVAPLGPKAFATIFSDITLAKRQAEAIEKGHLAQRALLDNQPQLTWLKDCDGHFLAVNKAFADACGQPSPDAMVGKTDLDVWPLDLATAYRADDADVMRNGVQKVVEERIAAASGTRWVETYKSPVFAPDGSIVGTTGIARDITEQKKAIEARRQSERKFEQVFNLAPDPIAVNTMTGEVLYANEAFLKATGYDRDELLGHHTTDFGLWTQPELRAEMMRQLYDKGRVEPFEMTLRSKSGAVHTMEMVGSKVEVDGQHLVLTAARDITERRVAEERAREAAETLSHYFTLSPDLLCIANHDARFVRLNPAWEQVLGFSLSELEGAIYLDFVHPDDVQVTLLAMSHLSAGGRVVDFQNRFRTKDGSYRWLEWRSTPADQLVYAVARDITRRREDEAALLAAERAAARSREQLLKVAELAHIGYFTYRVATGTTTWTPELYRIMGFDPQSTEPTRAQVLARIHPDDVPQISAAADDSAKDRPSNRLNIRVIRPNGELRYCEAVIEGDVDEQGRHVIVGQVQDLTEMRRAEEERHKLEQQVMQSQKLESLGVLAGGIAHDFNNLLTSILGNADLAQRELSPASPVGAYLEDIEQVSRRAAELCRQMLAYSGKGRFVVQPLSLNDAVREMAHLLSVSISKKAVIKYSFFADLPSVMADATQIRQIVMNLITNASDAIDEVSGVITLSTGVMDCDEEYLKNVVGYSEQHHAGQYVYLEVSDTGCGIDPENISRIFDPFYTTKFTGRGLGLAAVMGIVRGHGGVLRVYSEKGRGTTFKILLPAHHEPAHASDSSSKALSHWKGHGLVLLADDEESIRSMG